MNPMGDERYMKTDGADRKALGNVRLAVIASAGHIADLQGQAAAEWLGNVDYVSLPVDEPVVPELIGTCDVAVVQIDPAQPSSFDRIRAIKKYDPDLPLIVATSGSDLATVRTLIRAGVADVVSLPLEAEEILQTVLAIVEVNSEKSRNSNARLAPVIAVTRAMGGGGSTTVVTHLAAAFADADAAQPNVCIIDLDLQYGRVAETVGLDPRRTVEDLLSAGSRLDAAYMRSVAVPHAAGFAVVAAPFEISPIEAIDVDRLSAVIRTARREFDVVLVDMPANLTNWGLSFLSSADQVVMVVEPKVAAIRQAKRRIDLFRNLGLDLRLLSIVLNKAENKMFGAISVASIEEALRRPIDFKLREESKILSQAQEQGLLTYEWKPKNGFWNDIAGFAQFLKANRLAEAGQ